jgi:predicted glycosyltransferase
MKILIDIGHPAHVHYFKNIITQLQQNGHYVFVIAREKEVAFRLLTAYNIPFTSRGKGKNSLFGKFFYLFKGAYAVYKQAKKNKIDLFLSFASPYNALASILYKKPVITLDDTEHNVFNHKIYTKFSSSILTPKYFKKDFGSKHIRFNATMESAYLHSEYFTPENLTLPIPQTQKAKKQNVLLRFVSWQASHDVNQKGFTNSDIKLLIDELSQVANVHISSEKNLPQAFNQYVSSFTRLFMITCVN